MEKPTSLDNDKKLHITYRVEPGCLGPNGKSHIEDFCAFANGNMNIADSHYIQLAIVPRYDKSLPEMQYNITDKKLSHDQAEKYLAVFQKSLDDFESELSDSLSLNIEEFIGRGMHK